MRRPALYCLSILTLLLLAACPDPDKRDSGHVEEETRTAIICGRRQALRLAPSGISDSLEMEKILIDVRVREAELRREGEESLADCYINSFLATLDSVNPALHSEITTE